MENGVKQTLILKYQKRFLKSRNASLRNRLTKKRDILTKSAKISRSKLSFLHPLTFIKHGAYQKLQENLKNLFLKMVL